MRPKIVARNVVKTYKSKDGDILAIDDFSLEVAEGEFVCIVGPSGCGKSTFLRILAGLTPLTAGTVDIARDAKAQKPLNSMVFQEYAIYPWKTVRDNVAFGLEMRGVSKHTRYVIAEDWLKRVGLLKFANYYPHQLSGGMKQRVSIARALANDPEVLLMDEPLGALDAQMRTVLQGELLNLWEIDRKTVVYITHSIDEAILLGDRVIVMTAHPGKIKMEFTIEIPRPRMIETMSTPEFALQKGIIWEALKDEVARVYGEQL
ncbi:MAG: ABC transporter ATP-binding protein [Chloroflexi bacterium]|nr:ABC transporter ATP-binding protein [Chloroflexota bacterium]